VKKPLGADVRLRGQSCATEEEITSEVLNLEWEKSITMGRSASQRMLRKTIIQGVAKQALCAFPSKK
jgi:hypothetical protein